MQTSLQQNQHNLDVINQECQALQRQVSEKKENIKQLSSKLSQLKKEVEAKTIFFDQIKSLHIQKLELRKQSILELQKSLQDKNNN